MTLSAHLTPRLSDDKVDDDQLSEHMAAGHVASHVGDVTCSFQHHDRLRMRQITVHKAMPLFTSKLLVHTRL